MRITVNLATRPFIELRPLYAKLRIAMGLLTILSIALGIFLHSLSTKAKAATEQMDALRGRTDAFQQERARNEARMHQPQNMGVLERSQFLNALFARKSFSWTAVMMDLERVVPTGIQVTSIEPVISKEGDVSIRLRVTGDRDQAIALVRNLEKSQRFLSPRINGETFLPADKAKALGQNVAVRNVSATGTDLIGNAVEFEIISGYNPLPETPVAKAKTVSTTEPAASDETIIVHHQRKAGKR